MKRSALLLCLAPLAPAQDPLPAPPANNLARAADGAPICGLGKDFHAGRRAALREALGSGVFVMRGEPGPRENVAFRQDKNFWWLTGVESPDVALVMDVDSGEEILFVARPSAFKERWEGEIWDADDPWVKQLTGIEDVRPVGDLLDAVEGALANGGRKLWTSKGSAILLSGSYDAAGPYDQAREKDPLDGRVNRAKAFAAHLEVRFDCKVQDANRAITTLRAIKTPEEVEAVRRASVAAALAMKEAMRSCRPGLGEWDLASLLTWTQARHGADGPAYAAIVGAGANSLVLHYNFSARRLRAEDVVLIDFAPEVDHYVSDVTRTFPVDGTFSEEQAKIYDAVLDAQLAGIATVKPGARLADVEEACRDKIKEHGLTHLMLHGACHSVGMAVHDPGMSHRDRLEVGMAFTIEPGLYDPESRIGVRIEDVVVVTEDGCEVLSKDVPKQRAEIEAVMAEEGVLDWMDARRDR